MAIEQIKPVAYVNDNGRHILVSAASSYLDLAIVRIIPEAIIFSKIDQYRIWFVLFAVSSILIVFIFSISTYRFIHKPLARLVKAFPRVEDGNMAIEIKHDHNDEFSYIYSQFNNMVKNLGILINQVLKQKDPGPEG